MTGTGRIRFAGRPSGISKRMAALAFAAPVMSSFILDGEAFGGPSNQHGQNQTKQPCPPPNQYGQNQTEPLPGQRLNPPPNQYGL